MEKRNTKQMKAAYRNYIASDILNIYQAYRKPSSKKANAWEWCKDLCRKYDGESLKVVSYNDNYFTAGFEFEKDGKRYFCWITADHNRYMEV